MKRRKFDAATRRVLARKGRRYKPMTKTIAVEGARVTWCRGIDGIGVISCVLPTKEPN